MRAHGNLHDFLPQPVNPFTSALINQGSELTFTIPRHSLKPLTADLRGGNTSALLIKACSAVSSPAHAMLPTSLNLSRVFDPGSVVVRALGSTDGLLRLLLEVGEESRGFAEGAGNAIGPGDGERESETEWKMSFTQSTPLRKGSRRRCRFESLGGDEEAIFEWWTLYQRSR